MEQQEAPQLGSIPVNIARRWRAEVESSSDI
jgi:hypothetical protein